MRIWLLILIIISCSAQAATWYVRPAVYTNWSATYPNAPIAQLGIYGLQDGTSYINAWNGLQSIVWGAGGVTSGDTLYICGSHLYWTTKTENPYSQAYVIVDPLASGCTIRMDYATDPGQMFGGCLDFRSTFPVSWQGPDANGVYRTTNYYADYAYLNYDINGTNYTRLTTTNVSSWTGGQGYWSRVTGTNYVKMLDGSAPTTNTLALNENGWRLALVPGLSNVTFIGCKFIASALYLLIPEYDPGMAPLNCGANHLTFRNCIWRDGGSILEWKKRMVAMETGHDYWTFDGCELYNGPAAIYTMLGNQDGTNQLRGIIGLVVTNCYIHDIDTLNYPSSDGHAVGAQGNCECRIVNNRIERTGQAIAFWHGGVQMSSNIIANNFIKDIHWYNIITSSGGVGIWISSEILGLSTSNTITRNVVINCGIPGPGAWEDWMGQAISCSSPDHIDILNNTISNANEGINLVVNLYPPKGRIENNIICHTTNYLIQVSGGSLGGSVICNYNLFYTNALTGLPFSFPSDIGHDTNSIYGNPMFIGFGNTSEAYRLSPYSPAINSGTNVGLPYCQSAPDIGAIEFCNQMLLNTINARNIRISP